MKKKIAHANTLAASKNLAVKFDYILSSADIVVFIIRDDGIFTHFRNHECFLKTNLKQSFIFRVHNKLRVGDGTLLRYPFVSLPLNKCRMMCNCLSKTGHLKSLGMAVTTELLAGPGQRCLPMQNL